MGQAQQDAETICDLKTKMGELILDLDQRDRRIAELEARIALQVDYSLQVGDLERRNIKLRKLLDRVAGVGHNNNCIFCGLKDKVVRSATESDEQTTDSE